MDHRSRLPVRRSRVALAAASAAALAAGCGGGGEQPAAAPRTLTLNWHEVARLDGRPLLEFRVERIRVYAQRWEVDASVRNRSPLVLAIEPPPKAPLLPNWFGVAPLPTREAPNPNRLVIIHHGDTFDPELPRELAPGATWRGTFGGLGAIRPRSFVRVTFGMFEPRGGQLPLGYDRLAWVSDHVVRLP